MNNLSVVTLFISVALVSTKSLYETRIINGDRAREGQFPYQAYLQKLDNKVFCGASIVSNRFLLTAAHCTQGNPDPTVLVAVLGAINLQEGGTTILLDTITPHEGFDMLTRSNDIALIRTASEIIFSNTVQPIALPCQNVPSEGVTHVVVSGWGKTNWPGDGDGDNEAVWLQFLESQAIDNEECKKRYEHYRNYDKYIHDTVLCASNKPNSGTCVGDSGGPLIDISDAEHKVLVGIVSWGVLCAKGYPDVYTRVYSYMDWIRENIARQSVDFRMVQRL